MAISKTATATAVLGAVGGKKLFRSTTVPTSGDVEVGDFVLDSTPSASQATGWSITKAGTFGSLTSRTGAITQSSFTLVVNSAEGINVGTYLTINGVTGNKQVTAKAGTTLTVDVAADVTSNSSLAYVAPSYVAMGNLAAA